MTDALGTLSLLLLGRQLVRTLALAVTTLPGALAAALATRVPLAESLGFILTRGLATSLATQSAHNPAKLTNITAKRCALRALPIIASTSALALRSTADAQLALRFPTSKANPKLPLSLSHWRLPHSKRRKHAMQQ